VPYKLNVYGPGGFFKPHVDTPSLSAARMIGTAVVVLPCAFSGGALRVCAGAGHLPVSAPGKPPTRELLFDWGVDPGQSAASTPPADSHATLGGLLWRLCSRGAARNGWPPHHAHIRHCGW